uniref:uncharacterized protein LOC118143809 n=1 Tax=Callithrix jacchus TaxID=9483 RepID=UPI00159F6E32|nr:uncharacterized protein LOC118143809 [Callithrix jacchus]
MDWRGSFGLRKKDPSREGGCPGVRPVNPWRELILLEAMGNEGEVAPGREGGHVHTNPPCMGERVNPGPAAQGSVLKCPLDLFRCWWNYPSKAIQTPFPGSIPTRLKEFCHLAGTYTQEKVWKYTEQLDSGHLWEEVGDGDTMRPAHVQGSAVASQWWFPESNVTCIMCTWSAGRPSRCCVIAVPGAATLRSCISKDENITNIIGLVE